MLRRAACSYRLAPVLGTITVLATGTAAHAQATFDGLWSVQIVTQAGPCGRGYLSYPARIVQGTVQNAGTMSFDVSGQVDRRGAVRVSLSGAGHTASGNGRLSSSTGTGRWSSPTIGCSGYWIARRQG